MTIKVSILAVVLVLSTSLFSAGNAENGKKIFQSKKAGNCLACHDVAGEKLNQPGMLGPKLTHLEHWTEKALYEKLWDPTKTHELSVMPPFGANHILDEQQLRDVVAYLKTIGE